MPLLSDLAREVSSLVKMGDPLPFADDLETSLTYLSESHPWLSEAENLRNRAKFLDLSSAIGAALREPLGGISREGSADWVSRLVEWWDEKRVAVITLNYDTVVERTAAMIRAGPLNVPPTVKCSDLYPVVLTPAAHRRPGGFGLEQRLSFRLFKLHGSVNWFYSGSSSFVGEAIYYVRVAEAAERFDTEAVADKVPLIVPPVTEKSSYFQHETLRSLWAIAGSTLRDATRVFCLGYSLPQTDITMRYFLHGNQPPGQVKFYLANTDVMAGQRFRSLLPDCYEVDTRFVYEVTCSRNSPIPAVVDALLSGELDKH